MSNRDLDVDVVTPFVVEPAKPIGNCAHCGIMAYEGDGDSCFACDMPLEINKVKPQTKYPCPFA